MRPEDIRRLESEARKAQDIYRAAMKVPRVLPEMMTPATPPIVEKNYQLANTLYDRVQHFIKNAEAKLEAKQELLVLFFDRVGRPILVSDLGYHNPNMMIVWGTDTNGEDCSVLVHMSSFELVLQVVEEKPEAPRRPIGFVAPQGEELA
jgi:hypothetical protein